MPPLHPNLVPLASLPGTWRGPGRGEYPAITPFSYIEEIRFAHAGKPFLSYSQRTVAADDGRGLHNEAGFLRVPGPGQVEWLICQPTGITEVSEGSYSVHPDGSISIEVTARHIGISSTAKPVEAMTRSFLLRGDELHYELYLGAVHVPIQQHLTATLRRQEAEQ